MKFCCIFLLKHIFCKIRLVCLPFFYVRCVVDNEQKEKEKEEKEKKKEEKAAKKKEQDNSKAKEKPQSGKKDQNNGKCYQMLLQTVPIIFNEQ